VGGSTKLLGVDTVSVIWSEPTGITGAFEGAVLGASLSLGVVLADMLIRRSRPGNAYSLRALERCAPAFC
jgi:hypothetical protein